MQGIEKLFGDRKAALRLFRMVLAYIDSMEKVKSEVTKSQVSFGTDRKFAWIWLPQKWIKQLPQDNIVLSIRLDHCVEDKRIKEVVQPYPGNWLHHIVITKAADFDEQVQKWLTQAWQESIKETQHRDFQGQSLE